MLPHLQTGPKTALALSLELRQSKRWSDNYSKNVLEAAHAMNLAVYDGELWHYPFDSAGNRVYIPAKPRVIVEEDPDATEPIDDTPLDIPTIAAYDPYDVLDDL